MSLAVKKMRYWLGDAPQICNGCDEPIRGIFYDMASHQGPWGFFCPSCAMFGPGCGKVGPGYGQKYARQPNGRYMKTEG